MSPALRESMTDNRRRLGESLVETIASAESSLRRRARELIAAGFVSTKFAVDNHLIDREGYLENIRAEFRSRCQAQDVRQPARYRRHAIYVRERGRRARIALVQWYRAGDRRATRRRRRSLSAESQRGADRARIAGLTRARNRVPGQLARRLRGGFRYGLARGARGTRDAASR